MEQRTIFLVTVFSTSLSLFFVSGHLLFCGITAGAAGGAGWAERNKTGPDRRERRQQRETAGRRAKRVRLLLQICVFTALIFFLFFFFPVIYFSVKYNNRRGGTRRNRRGRDSNTDWTRRATGTHSVLFCSSISTLPFLLLLLLLFGCHLQYSNRRGGTGRGGAGRNGTNSGGNSNSRSLPILSGLIRIITFVDIFEHSN